MEFYATLGAACADRETILALFRAGMTGARLNLSHTSLDACAGLLTALAGRVYRLMSLYKGNPPSLRRVLRMLREK